jgi:hypothetical protein
LAQKHALKKFFTEFRAGFLAIEKFFEKFFTAP